MPTFDPAAPAATWPEPRNITDQESAAACRMPEDNEPARARRIDQAANPAENWRAYGVKEEK